MSIGSGIFSDQAAAKAHLVKPNGGLSAEIYDLREDLKSVFKPIAALGVEEFTNPAAASTTAIKTAAATIAAVTTYDVDDLDGTVGGDEMVPPRNITITTGGATPANAPANATITGLVRDSKGDLVAQTETITIEQTGATAVGTKAFSKVTGISLPAADGTAATLAFGFGSLIGLARPLVSRAGTQAVLLEIEAGSPLTGADLTGTFVDAAASAPHGTYLAANVPNGTRDYALYYEYDPTG